MAESADTDTSTGSTTSSSSVGSTPPTDADASSGDPGSGSTAGDTSTSGDETTGTTGSPPADGQARFAVRLGEGIGDELVLVEYTEGTLGPETDLLSGLPEDLVLTTTTTVDDGRFLVPCWRVLPAAAVTCGIIDLASDPPGPFQSLASGAVPEGTLIRSPSWTAATRTLWFVPFALPDDGDVGIFSAPVRDGELGPPQLVLEPPAGQELVDYAVGPQGLQLGYVLQAEDGGTTSHVLSADPLDDTPSVLISDPPQPDQRVGVPRLLPEASAAWYAVRDDTNMQPNAASLWFVDLSGASPAPPVRMDTPVGAEQRLDPRAWAPDRHALTYWVGPIDDIFAGDLMWVDLSSGSPQPPVLISTLASTTVTIRSAVWSADSRWLGYEAGEGSPDGNALYLVDSSGPVPTDPVRVGEGLVLDGGVYHWAFDQDSQWVYVIAEIDKENTGLFRVDISSGAVGATQLIEGPAGWVDEELVFSHDGSALLHSALQGGASSRQIALADVAGRLVEPSVLVNSPLPKGSWVTYGPRFSADDSVVAYRESTSDPALPRQLRLADRGSGEVIEVDFGERGVGAIYAAPPAR